MDEQNRYGDGEAKAAFWRHHIAAWRAGELGQQVYCEQHGLPRRSLQNWRVRLQREADDEAILRDRKARSARHRPRSRTPETGLADGPGPLVPARPPATAGAAGGGESVRQRVAAGGRIGRALLIGLDPLGEGSAAH
jgi:hypothetical protein